MFLLAGPAFAQTAAERALTLAYEGDALFAKGKWSDAYDRFAEAEKLEHSPVFVLYMARARRNANQLLSAASLYRKVASEKQPSDAPKPFRDALADAVSELAETEARTPRLKVAVRGVPAKDVTVLHNGEPFPTNKLVFVDPGSHSFTARSGGQLQTRVVRSAAGDEDTEVLMDFSERQSGRARGGLAPGIVVLSIGALGIDVGIVSGAIAAKISGDVKEGCIDNHCLRSDADALSSARTLATVSTVSFIAGGVAAATGLVLVVTRPGASSGPEVAVGPSGLLVRGRFP